MLWVSLIIPACDPTSFEFPAYQAEIYAPVLDIELDVEDLILTDTSDILFEDTSGLVSIQYDLSSSKDFEEIFPIEDQAQSFSIPGITGSFPDFTHEYKMPLDSIKLPPGHYPVLDPTILDYEQEVQTDKFITANFASGNIQIEVINEFPFALNEGLVIELINEDEEDSFFKVTSDVVISPDQTYKFEIINIAEKSLTGSLILKVSNFATNGGNNLLIEPSKTLTFNISFNNIVFDKAQLYQPQIDLPSFQINFNISSEYGARIKQLEIESGQLIFDVPEFQESFILETTFPTATQNGSPVTFELSNERTEIHIDNLNIDLSTQTPDYNVLPVEFKLDFNDALEMVEIEFDRPIEGLLKISDIDYHFMTGYLGQSAEKLEEQMELEIFHGVQHGKIEFDDPQLTIRMSNGAGATVLVSDDGEGLYIIGQNERLYGDQEVMIGNSMEGFVVNPALEPGLPQSSVLEINKQNEPELGAFFSLLPTKLNTRIPVIAGSSDIKYDQFLYDDAQLGIDFQIVLPLHIAADRLILTDTSDYRIQNDPDKIEIQSAIF